MTENQETTNIDRLLDVEMEVTVRFGSTELPLSEIVHFGSGSMIELNRTVDEPVELLVNNFPFARGEVVVVDGYYGVKITDIDMLVDSTGSPFINSAKQKTDTTAPNYQKAPDAANQSPKAPSQASPDAESTKNPAPQNSESPTPKSPDTKPQEAESQDKNEV